MTASELVAAIESAATKNSLESLLAEAKPEIVIDKRKSLATLKAEVLGTLQGQSNNTHELPETGDELIVLPEIDDGEVIQEEKVEAPRNRIVVNTINGRLLLWTPVLSANPDFREV